MVHFDVHRIIFETVTIGDNHNFMTQNFKTFFQGIVEPAVLTNQQYSHKNVTFEQM